MPYIAQETTHEKKKNIHTLVLVTRKWYKIMQPEGTRKEKKKKKKKGRMFVAFI